LYVGDIPGIAEFTWSDLLTRDTNDRGGVCDEIAVVAVSYLRALGIKSRLKVLTWSEAGVAKPVQHEALEYEDDNGQWRHLDAGWRTFNDPTAYRLKGLAQNLLVMDATFPLDSRSSAVVRRVGR
jgi:transglutaminase-like putative cysteine protease